MSATASNGWFPQRNPSKKCRKTRIVRPMRPRSGELPSLNEYSLQILPAWDCLLRHWLGKEEKRRLAAALQIFRKAFRWNRRGGSLRPPEHGTAYRAVPTALCVGPAESLPSDRKGCTPRLLPYVLCRHEAVGQSAGYSRSGHRW